MSSIADKDHFSIDYKLEETSYPHPDLPNSKLLVFKTRSEARKFKQTISWTISPHSEIYKVEVTKPVTIDKLCYPSILICDGPNYTNEINYFWSDDSKPNEIFIDQLNNAPTGTIGVDSVKLVKKVKE